MTKHPLLAFVIFCFTASYYVIEPVSAAQLIHKLSVALSLYWYSLLNCITLVRTHRLKMKHTEFVVSLGTFLDWTMFNTIQPLIENTALEYTWNRTGVGFYHKLSFLLLCKIWKPLSRCLHAGELIAFKIANQASPDWEKNLIKQQHHIQSKLLPVYSNLKLEYILLWSDSGQGGWEQ